MVDVPRTLACWLLVVAACGSSPGKPDAPTGIAGLGAHALNHYGAGANSGNSISTPAMTTQPGSTIVVSVGRGILSLFDEPGALPTDSKGNAPYQQQGVAHNYTHYMSSGTALYTFAAANGGAGFTVSTRTGASDEITLAAVEVLGRTQVQAFDWNEVVQPDSGPAVQVTSHSVTTTGPATLVAFWWGDAPEPMVKTAVPDNGFQVVESILAEGALVQCAAAVKDVAAAGTYNVTWAATPRQGAQLWLIAIQ
jgi:hypothetical protein